MSAWHVIWLCGLAVLIAGRFHFLFRESTPEGYNLPTRTSNWLRFGSLYLTIVLWAVALVLKVRSLPS